MGTRCGWSVKHSGTCRCMLAHMAVIVREGGGEDLGRSCDAQVKEMALPNMQGDREVAWAVQVLAYQRVPSQHGGAEAGLLLKPTSNQGKRKHRPV